MCYVYLSLYFQADNHEIRESACACILELATKIRPASVVEPFVARLVDALIACLRDESWPVRDTASVAIGNFVKAFATLCESRLETVLGLMFDHVSDNVPTYVSISFAMHNFFSNPSLITL